MAGGAVGQQTLRGYVVRVSANLDPAAPATGALAARLLAPLAEDGLSA